MSEIDELLNQHAVLRAAMPRSWNAFFARFGRLRPVQLASMPCILAGKSTLVSAPTAGGKTEAIVAPICERLLRDRWAGLSVLLITPTRALVNDLFSRLQMPLSAMRIGLGRKTSDHAAWAIDRTQVLVTTPESTESLLTFHKSTLASVRAVIIDEIHLLHETPRGDQLRLLLKRLSRFIVQRDGDGLPGLQRVAMSATVSNPNRIAAAFLGPAAVVIAVPGQRQIESKIITVEGNERDRIAAAVLGIEQFADARKILVFANSRKQVDLSASLFQAGTFAKAPVYGHHGSLSKHTRESVEQRFKSDDCAICIATMTLEVGIDIGDIDLVVCLDPPFSLSSFLQRIGRGCRRLNGMTRVLCVARDAGSELIFRALIRQATLGMPAGPVIPFRRSVLVQQALAYLRQVDKHRRTFRQFGSVFHDCNSPVLSDDALRHMLREMTGLGLLDCQSEVFRPACRGWEFIQSSKIYTNIAPVPRETEVVDADTGKTIASVAAIETQSGGVKIAGKSYEVLPGGTPTRRLVRSGGDSHLAPRYHARALPYSFDVGAALAAMLAPSSSLLLCLRVGDGVAVFTWLGKLLNLAVVHGLKETGVTATAAAFQIQMPVPEISSVVGAIHTAVSHICDNNPFDSIGVERVADLGPYFQSLSPQLQKLAKQDWLDVDFMRGWSKSVTHATEVPLNSELGRKLAGLA